MMQFATFHLYWLFQIRRLNELSTIDDTGAIMRQIHMDVQYN